MTLEEEKRIKIRFNKDEVKALNDCIEVLGQLNRKILDYPDATFETTVGDSSAQLWIEDTVYILQSFIERSSVTFDC